MWGETKPGNVARTRFSRLANIHPEQGQKIFAEMPFSQYIEFPQQARTILEAVHESLLVLDRSLKILFANASFHHSFQVEPGSIEGREFFSLNDGAWKIPGLQALLKAAQDGHSIGEGFEALEFSQVGARTFLLYAGKLIHENRDTGIIFLSFSDVTAQRALEQGVALLREKSDQLLRQKDILLAEIQHRVVNSLQLIASILMLKARGVASDETRRHLHDAHRRVLSIAAIQEHLHSSGHDEMIEVAPYLSKLCASLAESMIDDSRQAALNVEADSGAMTSPDMVSLGLIVTELVINALKYARPALSESVAIAILYETNGTAWRLSVSDNGVGSPINGTESTKGGLGTSLVKALAGQLDAGVTTKAGPRGMSVSVTHPTFVSRFREVDDPQLFLSL